MLDLKELDESLKLRALGRLKESKHPLLKGIKNKINHENFLCPKLALTLDEVSVKGLNLLSTDRAKALTNSNLDTNRSLLEAIKGIPIKSVVNGVGRNSIIYFNLRLQNKLTLGELNDRVINSIKNFIDASLYDALIRTQTLNIARTGQPNDDLIFYGSKAYALSKLSSKEIRTHRKEIIPICNYKLGAIATPSEVITWGENLKKVTSIKHRNMLLKVAHGDVYTNLKKFKFRLKDSPRCSQCGQIENLKHKFLSCEYVAQIWRHTFRLTNSTRVTITPGEDHSNLTIGLIVGTNPYLLTIHAEILSRIHYLKSGADHLLHPKFFIRLALNYLANREKSQQFKSLLNDLLERL